MQTRSRRPAPRVWDLGKYEVGYSPGAWSYCTANSEHHPQPQYLKGEIEEADLKPCHCGAPQKFGYPVWVMRILSTSEFSEELAKGLGVGGFRHVETVARRHFRLKRQAVAWAEKQVGKYRGRKR